MVTVHQNASVYVASPGAGRRSPTRIGRGRGVYAYLIDGAASFDDQDVSTGDAAKVTDQPELDPGGAVSELILVDVPMIFEPTGVWSLRRSQPATTPVTSDATREPGRRRPQHLDLDDPVELETRSLVGDFHGVASEASRDR